MGLDGMRCIWAVEGYPLQSHAEAGCRAQSGAMHHDLRTPLAARDCDGARLPLPAFQLTRQSYRGLDQ